MEEQPEQQVTQAEKHTEEEMLARDMKQVIEQLPIGFLSLEIWIYSNIGESSAEHVQQA